MSIELYSRKPLAKRFWPKVDVRGADECWEWMASKTSQGYGCIWSGGRYGKNILTHRVSWELHNGSIPDGLCVLHHCDNRACVNPRHLFLGTYADNTHDMMAKGRSIHPRGEAGGKAKLTERKIHEIRALLACGLSLRVIGRRYGVNHKSIYSIKIGRNWGWLKE